jgi:anti-sigma regulatory factor (Ser/Thr protein kinase)
MESIAVLSSDKNLNALISQMCGESEYDFEPVFIKDKKNIVQYLNYELPEINIINYSDRKIKISNIIEAIKDDPWLHYGGVIAFYDDEDTQTVLDDLKSINLISVIRKQQADFFLPRVLRILSQNKSFLFQRDIHALLKSNLSGSFIIDNDPFDITTYSYLICNFLYNAGLVDHEQKERFHIALVELLMNAIEHGNCTISYEEKTRVLEKEGDIFNLIRKKNKNPEISSKKVYFSYRIRPNASSFKIKDEGGGFDWKSFRTKKGAEGLDHLHGRGILMASHYLGNIDYNKKGNEVSFELTHNNEESNTVPDFIADKEEVHVEAGDTIFMEGEKSSHLFYIVSGKYDILTDGRKISSLTPADIFLGEMSFLLNNRRSATVKAAGQGTLIRISKEEFISAIKEKPHYGIFLARLLSQRLVRLHKGIV